MKYKIKFTKKALKEAKKLPDHIWNKVKSKVAALEDNPFPQYAKQLKDPKVLYRIRVGDYRVVYEVRNRELIVLIVKVAHRK